MTPTKNKRKFEEDRMVDLIELNRNSVHATSVRDLPAGTTNMLLRF